MKQHHAADPTPHPGPPPCTTCCASRTPIFTVCRIWRSAPGALLPMAAAGCWILPHTKITLDVGSTVITFYGTALRIESLNGKRLTVAGRVARIDFAPKWEVDANEAPHSGSR